MYHRRGYFLIHLVILKYVHCDEKVSTFLPFLPYKMAFWLNRNQARYLAIICNTTHLRKTKMPQKGLFLLKNQNFHKSKVDSLKKLSTRACPFYEFLHFKGCPFTKGEILERSIVRFLKFFLFQTPMTF